MVDIYTFVFYSKDASEMELVLRRGPCSFGNSLLVVQKLHPGMAPYSLAFDATPIWVQIHDLPLDWRVVDMIVRRIVGSVSFMIEVDKFSLTTCMTRLVLICLIH